MLHFADFFKDNTLRNIIRFMEQSKYQFYLTGSQYFGGANENSDWDFFAQYSVELEQELVKEEFERHSAYKSHIDVSVVYKKSSVHIQLIGDIGEKRRIQEIIKSQVPMAALNHNQRKMMWHLAYKAFREGNK